jgi:hypothetical protein
VPVLPLTGVGGQHFTAWVPWDRRTERTNG